MLLNYHIGRLVLISLCVGDLVRLVLGGVRFAGFSLGLTFYMFRTVFPSIIRSSQLYIQQQAIACCCMYSLELLMMDGKTVRNM